VKQGGTTQEDGQVKSSKKTHDWKTLLRHSISKPEQLAKRLPIDPASIAPVVDAYPMRINPYYWDLAVRSGRPLLRQVVPETAEIHDAVGMEDPLAEDKNSPAPRITHRYPDRVLFTVTNVCAVYCRFCTRKRRVGRGKPVSVREIEDGIRYIKNTPAVRDVLVSGGDPFVLSDERIEWLLRKLREIPHVETIRIGTRTPCVLPSRITPSLGRILRKIRPLYINVHFNHPSELTDGAARACGRLADAGAVLGNQTVLLRGINDEAPVLAALFRGLLKMRVRPYYLLQADLTKGTDHFRTPIETGLSIMEALRGHVTGLAVPHYVVDLPGGGGKVPLVPGYTLRKRNGTWIFRNYVGAEYRYPPPGGLGP
jgi:lysine 2,3-aminomutase